MAGTLTGKRVAILLTDGFEQAEMVQPRTALHAEGAQTTLIAPHAGQVKAWHSPSWGDTFSVDVPLDQAKVEDYDALLLPGGVMNPDHLRTNAAAVQFVKAFFEAGKPVAALCHAPWTMVNADVLRGRTLTSWPSLHTDIQNAGGNWVSKQVVRDGNLVTCRMPADIPAFNPQMIDLFATWQQ